jgi:hypothetical protein
MADRHLFSICLHSLQRLKHTPIGLIKSGTSPHGLYKVGYTFATMDDIKRKSHSLVQIKYLKLVILSRNRE